MTFTCIGSWLWAAITGGGVFVLAVAYAWVLLQRQRARGRVVRSAEALLPEPDARTGSQAFHVLDLVGLLIALLSLAAVYGFHSIEAFASVLVAIWVGVSPWVIGTATILPAIAWSNAGSGAAIIVLSLLGLWQLSGHLGYSPATTIAE
jgi:hypothetical protein